MKVLKILVIFILIAATVSSASCGKVYGKLIETKTDGDFSFDIYGKENVILRIKIKKNGKEVCVISCNGRDFKTVDLNFDGYNDIMLSSAEKDEGYYQCFIYQPSTDTFTENTVLHDILNPVFDSENNRISCEVRTKETITQIPDPTYKEVRGNAVWYWKNGVLTQLSENGIEYFTDGDIYCVYSAAEVNGEFVRNNSDDLWFWSYDELVSAGYTWEN